MTTLVVPRWIEIMHCILDAKKIPTTSHYIKRKVNITYSYLFHVLTELNEKGFVKYERRGREHMIYLTDIGVTLANGCRMIGMSLK